MTAKEIIDAARALPSSERAQVIHALWDSLSLDEWPAPTEAWVTEAEERSNALDRGEMTASPWSEVRERARRKAGLDG